MSDTLTLAVPLITGVALILLGAYQYRRAPLNAARARQSRETWGRSPVRWDTSPALFRVLALAAMLVGTLEIVAAIVRFTVAYR